MAMAAVTPSAHANVMFCAVRAMSPAAKTPATVVALDSSVTIVLPAGADAC